MGAASRSKKYSWALLEGLLNEYYSEKQKGYGRSLDTRNERQVEISNEIVTRSRRMLKGFALRLHSEKNCSIFSRGQRRTFSTWGTDLTLADVISEATLSLLEAIPRYDPGKATNVQSFFYSQIPGPTYERINAAHGLYRIPPAVLRVLNKATDSEIGWNRDAKIIAKRLSQYQERDDQPLEIIAIAAIRRRHSAHVPLHRLNKRDYRTPLDFIVNPDAQDPLELLLEEEKTRYLQKLLKNLEPECAEVLNWMTGFDGRRELTFEQIGEMSGVNRDAIVFIRKKALEQCKKAIHDSSPDELEIYRDDVSEDSYLFHYIPRSRTSFYRFLDR